MVRRSSTPRRALCRAAKRPNSGRSNWPMNSGSTSHCRRSKMTLVMGKARPAAPSTRPSQSGVSSTPSRLESVALNTAAGTLPLAVAVRATEEETVDGNAHRKNRPVRKSTGKCRPALASSKRPKSGQSKNVQVCTKRWSRQLRAPAPSAASDKLRPCRKKIRDTPSLFKSSGCKLPPLAPGPGSSQASSTATPMPSSNQSGRVTRGAKRARNPGPLLDRAGGRSVHSTTRAPTLSGVSWSSNAHADFRSARAIRLAHGAPHAARSTTSGVDRERPARVSVRCHSLQHDGSRARNSHHSPEGLALSAEAAPEPAAERGTAHAGARPDRAPATTRAAPKPAPDAARSRAPRTPHARRTQRADRRPRQPDPAVRVSGTRRHTGHLAQDAHSQLQHQCLDREGRRTRDIVFVQRGAALAERAAHDGLTRSPLFSDRLGAMLERAFLSAQAAVLLVLAGCDRTPSSNSTTKARSAGETASVVAVPPTAKASESTASAGALVVPASQIHQPSGLSPGERRPLLIFLHGLGAS